MKLKHSILALVAMLSGFAFAANAQEATEVATLDELQAALAAEDNNSIVLTEAIAIPAGQTVELDLKGKTITCGTDGYCIENENGSAVTIKDSKGSGVVNGIVYNAGGSTMIIDGGTYNAIGSYALLNNAATMIINGGIINGKDSYPIYSYNDRHELTINNVTVNGECGCINAYYAGEVIINDGTFNFTGREGYTYHIVYVSTGTTMTINGGTFKKVGDVDVNGEGGGGICANGTGRLFITGGTFDGAISDIDNYSSNTTIEVSGGTFSDMSAKNYVVDGFELKQNADGTYGDEKAVAKIGTKGYATFAEALAAAKTMTGDVTVELYDKVTFNQPLIGNYTSINFVGKAENAEMYLDVQGYTTATGKEVTFTDLKLSKSVGGYVANAGFMNLAFGIYDVVEVTYNNCTFLNGAYASSGEVTFNGCTFYRSHDRYGLWAYGAPNVTVEGCTFADIRGIKVYDEGKQQLTGLTVKNTDFSAVDNKPAIVLTSGKSVVLEGNTYNAEKGMLELDLDGNPNGTPVTSDVDPVCVNDNGACGVLVDGKIYTTVAQAKEVATSTSTVTLLHNSTETVEFPEGVTLDKNGFEAAGVTVAQPSYVAKIGEQGYATLTEAFAAVTSDDQTVVILSDVTENLVGSYLRGNITTENGAKVTITLTNSDWVYCPYTFVVGENITLNIPAFFYYAGGTQINGTVVAGAYYQMYQGTKLTINEPGSMTVTGETFILRYTEGDHNAGIYINGDNNDESVGLNASVIYFYQGMINAKDANINTGVYWQTNETDNQGSANLVLDNSKMNVTVSEQDMKTTGNSTMTLTNGSVITIAGGYEGIEGYAALPNLDGKFVVGAEPTATVNKLGAMTVAESDYIVYNGSKSGDMPLSFVMQFLADQNKEDMKNSPFADWYGDFVLTFSGLENNFVADGCYLAGYYGDFGWVKVPVDGMTIEKGVRYPVMLGVGLGQKYDYICSEVKDFRCALYLTPEVLAANPNLTVTLELSVVDNSKGEDAATKALVNKNNIYEVVAEEYAAIEFSHVEFVDGKEFVNEADRTVASLTYKRTLPYANFWMPLYVPFNIPMSALIENYDVARFNGVNAAGTIELVKIEDSEAVLANTPLVIRAKSEEAKTMEITLNDVVLKANTVNEVTCGSYKIRGTYQRTTINDNERVLGMSAEGKAAWGKLAAGVSLNPQRLILTITDSSLNSIRMRVVGEDSDEDVTNIYDVEVDAEQGARIFDLQGRRVLEPQKGHLYIINGKKVVY